MIQHNKIKTIDFIRQLFATRTILSYQDLCRKVQDNKTNLLDLPVDHKHKIRAILYHLKNKQKEIVSVKRGMYKKV